jgi:phospholipid/cholesterol/gamma-HCH transport system ATP-binding protein
MRAAATAPPSPSPWRRRWSDTQPAHPHWALEWLPSPGEAAAGPYGDLHLQLASQDIVNLRGLSALQRYDVFGIMSCDAEPAGSTIRIAGFDPWQLPPQERSRRLVQDLGYAAADAVLGSGLSVRDNIALPLLRNDVAPHTAFEFVEAELSLLGLAGCADLLPRHLSPSEYRRTVLACATVHCPQLLIYEPPHAELPAVEVALVRHRLWLSADRQGCAVLMSSEQPELASLAPTTIWPRWPLLSPALVQLRDPA